MYQQGLFDSFFSVLERRSANYRMSSLMFASIDLLTSVTALKVPCGLGVVASEDPASLAGSVFLIHDKAVYLAYCRYNTAGRFCGRIGAVSGLGLVSL